MNTNLDAHRESKTAYVANITMSNNNHFVYKEETEFSNFEKNRLICYGMQHIIGRNLEFSAIKVVEQSLNANVSPRILFNQRAHELLVVEQGYVLCNEAKLAEGSIVAITPGEIYELSCPESVKIRSAFYPGPLALTHLDWPIPLSHQDGDPDVSIIIIAKDLEGYICQCISSCIQQTHGNIEIIVVDDNSGDRTLHKVLLMAKYDSRIRVFPRDCGRNQARRIGIEKARGRFLLVIDGDDWINKDTIELLLKSKHKTKSECTIFGFDHYDDVTTEIFNPVYPHEAAARDAPIFFNKDRSNSKWTASHNHTIWMVMFSSRLKSVAIQSLPDVEFYEDLPFLICLLATNCKNAVCNHVLYHYRRNRNGQSTANWSNLSATRKQKDLESVIHFMLNKLEKNDNFSESIIFRKVETIVRYEVIQNYLKGEASNCSNWIVFWINMQRCFGKGIVEYLDQGSQVRKFLWCNKTFNSLILKPKFASAVVRNYIEARIRYEHSKIFSIFRSFEKWF